MKIEITKASGEFWYSDCIGEKFVVLGEIDGDYYVGEGPSLLVDKDDCKIVKDQN
ncbi:MAG: hypothetical protein K0R18_393 [Bacillales bacterium]|jgi:hypothetical protein|nr:hypothetical protein [Bacillales bacterium]